MHPLVDQLQFARSEFGRVFDGVTDDDGSKRLMPMNSLGWIVAHLALQEQRYWIVLAQGREFVRHPELAELSGYPDRATTPALSLVRAIWTDVTATADQYLRAASDEDLAGHFEFEGDRIKETIGTLLLRNIHHYWFHTGEAHAIRQQLGHLNLPDYVGDQSSAPFRSSWRP